MDVHDGVRRARRSVDSALRLVDDLLQLARTEADGVVVRREAVRIHALVMDVVDEWRAIANAKGLAIAADLPPIEVRDTGPGLSAEQSALLFQEFRRLDSAVGTKGYGLGLAISSRLAAALGGRITVARTLGEGSTFCLWLPTDPS